MKFQPQNMFFCTYFGTKTKSLAIIIFEKIEILVFVQFLPDHTIYVCTISIIFVHNKYYNYITKIKRLKTLFKNQEVI